MGYCAKISGDMPVHRVSPAICMEKCRRFIYINDCLSIIYGIREVSYR